MDALLVLTGIVVSFAVFAAALVLQTNLGATRQTVQARTTGTYSTTEAPGRGLSLAIREVASEGNRRTALELERAGSALSTSEYFILRIGMAVIGVVVGALIATRLEFSAAVTIVILLLGGLLGYFLPAVQMGRRTARRSRLVEDQLVEMLVSMTKSMRAGIGLTQAMEYAGRDTPAPLGSELLRVVSELQLGADLEVVLDELNKRIASPDLEIASTAIIIQRRVGGNLSEVLTNVANTMRERRMIRNELRAITAKGRFQGILSSLIPIVIAVLFMLVNPDTARLLFETTAGRISLAAGIGFELVGIWAVNRFSTIEV